MKPKGVARVSQLVKTFAALALIGAAILVWYLRRERAAAAVASAPVTAGSAAPAPEAPRPPAHAKRITAAERTQLAAQIAKARAGRAATSAPAGPSLPAPAAAPPD